MFADLLLAMLWQRILEAASRRNPLAETNVLRLCDGIGDGMPGVFVEYWAGHWLVMTADASAPIGAESLLKGAGGFECHSVWWKRLDQEDKTSPHLLAGNAPEMSFVVLENGLRFQASFTSGYSQGLFLDQRLNRARVRSRVKAGNRILNLFAYTASFSVAAAAGGAVTTTLDLSQHYLDWGRENFSLNGLNPTEHYWIKGDALEWLAHFAKKRRQFDGIILDPPTFSRGAKGKKTFRVERDYGKLVELAAMILSPGGWLLASTNDRGLEHDEFTAQVRERWRKAGLGNAKIERAQMPPEFTGERYLKAVWVSGAEMTNDE